MPIRQIDLSTQSLSKSEYRKILPRANSSVDEAIEKIKPILQRVKVGDEKVLKQLAVEFDGVSPKNIKVANEDLINALAQLDPKIKAALEVAINQVRKVAQDQIPHSKTLQEIALPIDEKNA